MTEDEEMIKEAQLLKSAETDKGDSASLSFGKLSRLEYEILQMKKQMEDTLGKMSNLNESLELYKEDLSAANKTINDLREDAAQLMGNDIYAQLAAVTQLKAAGLPISDEYMYKTFGIDKPVDYDTLKKEAEEKLKALQDQQQQFQKNVTDFYPPRFFRRRPLASTSTNDGGRQSSDW